MVTVYQAKVKDSRRGEMTRTAHKGMPEWIAKLPGGEIIPDTAEEVPASKIDGQGRYLPEGESDA